MEDMKIGYKFTNKDMTTYAGFEWEIGKKVVTSGEGDLCGPGWIHFYCDPLLALFHNPIHANFGAGKRLWKVDVGGLQKHEYQMKSGAAELTLVREIRILRELTTEHCVRYAIGSALSIYHNDKFREWADKWLTGQDRSESAAWSAARSAAESAAWSAARSAASAVWAASAASAASAAWAKSAASAASAAWAESAARSSIDLITIAEWAITDSIDIRGSKR